MSEGKFHDYNPMPIKTAEAFVPTDACPISLHKQLAGDPFRSTAQRGFLFANHPKVAKKFAAETPKGAKLPRHVKRGK